MAVNAATVATLADTVFAQRLYDDPLLRMIQPTGSKVRQLWRRGA